MAGQSTSGSSSSGGPVLVPGAMRVFNQQLKLSEHNYSNILTAYAQQQANLGAQSAASSRGYTDLERQVLNTLGVGGGGWGVAQPAADAISRGFAQTEGQTQQQMINAGLGGTTLMGNYRDQNRLMEGQAFAGLGSNLAQAAAGYESQIGMAGLGSQAQYAGLESSLTSAYLGDLSHYNFTPNVPILGQQSQSRSAAQSTDQNAAAGLGGSQQGPGPTPLEDYSGNLNAAAGMSLARAYGLGGGGGGGPMTQSNQGAPGGGGNANLFYTGGVGNGDYSSL